MLSETDRETSEVEAAVWIARRGTPEWDAAAFESWQAASASNRVAYYRLNAAWMEAGRLKVLRTEPVDRLLKSGRYGLSLLEASQNEASQSIACEPCRPPSAVAHSYSDRRWRNVAAIAAGVALLVCGTLGMRMISRARAGLYATQIGGLEFVTLSDGSKITLNTDSEVRVSLAANERAVKLDHGEAYFQVAKDKARPFVVSVGGKRVIAVGTAFSVRRDGDDIQVVVDEGTVRLEPQTSAPGGRSGVPLPPKGSMGSADVLVLTAGTIARTQAEAVMVNRESTAEIDQQLSWRSGQLSFHDTPLSGAVEEFNRYNSRKIILRDPSLADLRLGGVFRANDIDLFIELLERGFPLRASEEGNNIVLTHN